MNWFKGKTLMGYGGHHVSDTKVEKPDVRAENDRIKQLETRNNSLQTEAATLRAELERKFEQLCAARDTITRTREIILSTLDDRARKARWEAEQDANLGPASRASKLAVAEELERIAEGWRQR